jgi:hypothetical protein
MRWSKPSGRALSHDLSWRMQALLHLMCPFEQLLGASKSSQPKAAAKKHTLDSDVFDARQGAQASSRLL